MKYEIRVFAGAQGKPRRSKNYTTDSNLSLDSLCETIKKIVPPQNLQEPAKGHETIQITGIVSHQSPRDIAQQHETITQDHDIPQESKPKPAGLEEGMCHITSKEGEKARTDFMEVAKALASLRKIGGTG